MKWNAGWLIAGSLLLTTGCAGSGGDEPPRRGAEPPPLAPPPPPSPLSPWAYRPCGSEGPGVLPPRAEFDALPGGIWQGTLTNELTKATEPYTAIVAEDGRFRLQSSGHTQWAGSLTTIWNDFTGEGFADSGGTPWHDGTMISGLSVAGVIAERDALTGNWAMVSGDVGCFELSYDAGLYERPSSTDHLAGSWVAFDDWGSVGMSLTIDVDGSFSGTGYYYCDLAGQLVLIDDRYNLYELQIAITGWENTTVECDLAGDYTGFAYLYDAYDGSDPNSGMYLSLVAGTEALRVYLGRWTR